MYLAPRKPTRQQQKATCLSLPRRHPPTCHPPAGAQPTPTRRLPSLLPLLASSHRKKGQPCFGNVNRVPAYPSRLRLPAARTCGEGSGGVVWWAPCIVPPTTTDDMSIVRQTVFVRYLTSNQAWFFSPVSSANKIISHRNCQPRLSTSILTKPTLQFLQTNKQPVLPGKPTWNSRQPFPVNKHQPNPLSLPSQAHHPDKLSPQATQNPPQHKHREKKISHVCCGNSRAPPPFAARNRSSTAPQPGDHGAPIPHNTHVQCNARKTRVVFFPLGRVCVCVYRSR